MNHTDRSAANRAPLMPRTLALALALMMSLAAGTQAAPAGGVVAAGSATIATSGAMTTVTQTTGNVVLNWQSFGIATGESVQFAQPGSGSVALNRVLGTDPSGIFGNLSSNGKVFLVNPNGVLFGNGASVNVGGLVASTLDISDANFMAGRYSFASPGSGSVVNQGSINADGGYVALLGTNVSNQGTISARLGTVALAAGQAVTLDVMGGNLLNVTVDQGAVNALIQNGGLIQADGGAVLMTTQAAGSLLSTVVNNTGVIVAQTIESRDGTISLVGDTQIGTVSTSGTAVAISTPILTSIGTMYVSEQPGIAIAPGVMPSGTILTLTRLPSAAVGPPAAPFLVAPSLLQPASVLPVTPPVPAPAALAIMQGDVPLEAAPRPAPAQP